MDSNSEQFKNLGLSEQKVAETLKNESLTQTLSYICQEVIKLGGFPEGSGMLLYHLASKIRLQIKHHIPFVVKYIIDKKLDSVVRLDASLEYLSSNPDEVVSIKHFEEACGIGIIVSPEDIEVAVEKAMSKYKSEILVKRYKFNTGLILREVRNTLKWADGRNVKNEVDVQILDMIGPKTEADLMPNIVKKQKSVGDQKTHVIAEMNEVKENNSGTLSIPEMMSKVNFHEPGENYKTDGYVITSNTKKLLEEHCKITNNKVRTRFPPEPNGILHIGHAKAININFGFAAYKGGECFLRYDDTNPEKEEERFFHGIKDVVEWLGYKPHKITHSSDYFDQLYEWAKTLIKKGLAYVCHQKQEDMQGFNPLPSPWRDRPIKENLVLFEDMKKGKLDEGEATLRMKVTLEEGKQDPVAYRIKYLPHHRTGEKWCIYPTYDYTHCLCDSIENITHSLCTKEFQSRRSSYYWLCNSLDIYCPVQWEYGRLNMNYTIVSKRKIAKLIHCGIVRDWDDPRLFTLPALRRRGFPSEAINRFCAQMGVTGSQSIVDPIMLEAIVRDVLNKTAPRTMVVLEPLKVKIIDCPIINDAISVPDFPFEEGGKCHTLSFSDTIYIEQTDFKTEDLKGYRRLSPSQTVGLKYVGLVLNLTKINFSKYDSSIVESIEVTAEKLKDNNKPKSFIHWVAEPISVILRLYSNIFQHKNPEDSSQVPGGFLSDINYDSLKEYHSFADKYLLQNRKSFSQYQFERLGFFSVDPDTTFDKLIFNRTTTLKEDSGKQ